MNEPEGDLRGYLSQHRVLEAVDPLTDLVCNNSSRSVVEAVIELALLIGVGAGEARERQATPRKAAETLEKAKAAVSPAMSLLAARVRRTT